MGFLRSYYQWFQYTNCYIKTFGYSISNLEYHMRSAFLTRHYSWSWQYLDCFSYCCSSLFFSFFLLFAALILHCCWSCSSCIVDDLVLRLRSRLAFGTLRNCLVSEVVSMRNLAFYLHYNSFFVFCAICFWLWELERTGVQINFASFFDLPVLRVMVRVDIAKSPAVDFTSHHKMYHWR